MPRYPVGGRHGGGRGGGGRGRRPNNLYQPVLRRPAWPKPDNFFTRKPGESNPAGDGRDDDLDFKGLILVTPPSFPPFDESMSELFAVEIRAKTDVRLEMLHSAIGIAAAHTGTLFQTATAIKAVIGQWHAYGPEGVPTFLLHPAPWPAGPCFEVTTCDERQGLVIRRPTLLPGEALAAASEPDPDDNPHSHAFHARVCREIKNTLTGPGQDHKVAEVRIKFGWVNFREVEQKKNHYPAAKLQSLLNALARRNTVEFRSGLSNLSPALSALGLENGLRDEAVKRKRSLEIVRKGVTIEMGVDLVPADRGWRLVATRPYQSRTDRRLSLNMAAPHRFHDWSLVVENREPLETVPKDLLDVVSRIVVAPLAEDDAEVLCALPVVITQEFLSRATIDAIVVRDSASFPLVDTWYMLQVCAVRTYRATTIRNWCELELFAPEWDEQGLCGVIPTDLDGDHNERLFNLVRSVDTVLAALDLTRGDAKVRA